MNFSKLNQNVKYDHYKVNTLNELIKIAENFMFRFFLFFNFYFDFFFHFAFNLKSLKYVCEQSLCLPGPDKSVFGTQNAKLHTHFQDNAEQNINILSFCPIL